MVLVVSQLEATPGIPAAARWAAGIVIAVAFFLSVLAHELGHGIVARRRARGRSDHGLLLRWQRVLPTRIRPTER